MSKDVFLSLNVLIDYSYYFNSVRYQRILSLGFREFKQSIKWYNMNFIILSSAVLAYNTDFTSKGGFSEFLDNEKKNTFNYM